MGIKWLPAYIIWATKRKCLQDASSASPKTNLEGGQWVANPWWRRKDHRQRLNSQIFIFRKERRLYSRIHQQKASIQRAHAFRTSLWFLKPCNKHISFKGNNKHNGWDSLHKEKINTEIIRHLPSTLIKLLEIAYIFMLQNVPNQRRTLLPHKSTPEITTWRINQKIQTKMH